MMNEVKVAVVILNFNGRYFLEKFLPAVIKNSLPYAVFVADNCSTDDSVAYLQQHFPQVTVIKNTGNYGYAKGYNLALKQINAEYFILLNSDVEVTEHWIDPVILLMENDHRIAACQPKLLDYKNQRLFEYAGASGGFIDKFGYPFCRGRVFNVLEEDQQQFNDAREIFWATGACMFVRASAFWQVGGLDDDYFAHMEEIDLCWRLKNFGYTIYVQPASLIYHVGGGTLSKLSARKTFLNFRNNLATLTKNHPGKNLFFKIVYRMILDGFAAFKFLFDGQPSHFLAVIKAHFAFYAWIPSLLQKRRQLKRQPGFKFSFSHIYKGNIAVEYFLKKKHTFSALQKGFFQE
jgi:GT2 family glycosyltransferase